MIRKRLWPQRLKYVPSPDLNMDDRIAGGRFEEAVRFLEPIMPQLWWVIGNDFRGPIGRETTSPSIRTSGPDSRVRQYIDVRRDLMDVLRHIQVEPFFNGAVLQLEARRKPDHTEITILRCHPGDWAEDITAEYERLWEDVYYKTVDMPYNRHNEALERLVPLDKMQTETA